MARPLRLALADSRAAPDPVAPQQLEQPPSLRCPAQRRSPFLRLGFRQGPFVPNPVPSSN